MTCTQVTDRRADRVVGVLAEGPSSDFDTLEGVHAVFFGTPDLTESLMCAKCIGECKIF